MKKWNFPKFKIKTIDVNKISDRMLVLNLYITQLLTLILGIIIILFQKNKVFNQLNLTHYDRILIWGICFAGLFLLVNMIISRWVPDEVSDDGGMNFKLFGNRALWHIFVISAVVAFCEELLFRGAIQHSFGSYWTSILFAAIHIRYLQNWIMTGLVFSVSYGLGWIYVQTGTLWTPILAHLLIDLIMGCIIRYRREA
ncbi:MAG: Abortive infection protein [Bacilli bacterium]|nr:Abortive infection protein [Bacilli bacterium]